MLLNKENCYCCLVAQSTELNWTLSWTLKKVSNFFQHHGLKHARPPSPSPSCGAC